MDEHLVIWEPKMEEKNHKRGLDLKRFAKQNVEILYRAVILFLVIMLPVGCMLTKKSVTEELSEQHKIELSAERFRVEQETIQRIKDEYGITEESVAQKARLSDSDWMAKALYPYIDNTDEGIYIAACVMKNRQISKGYPSKMEDIVSQKEQFMGWSEDNPIDGRLKAIALEVCETYDQEGAIINPTFVHMSWTPKEIVAIDNMEKNQPTHYYYESDMRDYLKGRD